MRGQSVPITYKGKTQDASQWGKELGMVPATILERFKCGAPIEVVMDPTRLRPGELQGYALAKGGEALAYWKFRQEQKNQNIKKEKKRLQAKARKLKKARQKARQEAREARKTPAAPPPVVDDTGNGTGNGTDFPKTKWVPAPGPWPTPDDAREASAQRTLEVVRVVAACDDRSADERLAYIQMWVGDRR